MIVQTTEPLLKRMLQIHSGSSFFIEPTCDYKILTSFFYGIEFSFSVPETRSVGKYAEAVFNRHSSRGWTNLVMTEICGWVEAPPEDKKLVVYDSLFEFFANYLRSTTSIEYSTLDDLKTACEYAIRFNHYTWNRHLSFLEGVKVGYSPDIRESKSDLERWSKYFETNSFNDELANLLLEECISQLRAHSKISHTEPTESA